MSAVSSLLNTVQHQASRLGIGQFLLWWLEELRLLLPPRIREVFNVRQPELRLAQAETGLVADFVGRQRRRLELTEDTSVAQNEIKRLLTQMDAEHADWIGVLPQSAALTRRLSLPLAIEGSLAQALPHQLDLHSPFKAEQVYFSHRIAKRDEVAKQLLVDLVIVPRARVDALRQSLSTQLNARLHGIDLQLSNGERAGLNLLPANERSGRDRKRLLTLLGLLALVGGLGFAVINAYAERQERQIDKLQEEFQKLQPASKNVKKLKRDVASMRAASAFLQDKRAADATTLELLRELTGILPDEVYLERLAWVNNEIQLQGQATEGAKLIATLSTSRLLKDPQLRGPLQTDPRTGKERFNVVAQPRSLVETKVASTGAKP
jgi:general secretion pathway protein L